MHADTNRMALYDVMCSLLHTITLLYLHDTMDAQQATHYFIHPTTYTDTQCPAEGAEPCFTLEHFAQTVQHNLVYNTTLIFLPGEHNLHSDISVTDEISYTMLGNYPGATRLYVQTCYFNF